MFEFLFNLPWNAFRKGTIVLARDWPLWWLVLLVLAALSGVVWLLYRRRNLLGSPLRMAALTTLQWAPLALLLLLLWQPALSISTLEAHQNAIAIVVDTSRSMAIADEGGTRIDAARRVLDGGLVESLKKRFTVVTYEAGAELRRVDGPSALKASQPATQLGTVLRQVAAESGTLPVGGVVLLSDGADNAGGVDKAALQALRAARIPVYTVGFGATGMRRDVELTDVQLPARALPGARLTATALIRQNGFAGSAARLEARAGNKVLVSRQIKLPADGEVARENLVLPAGEPGAQAVQIGLAPLDGESNRGNNALTRIFHVDRRKPRILYFEGEPRWELKFLRRAAEDDPNLEVASMLRTTQNKIYRQGIQDPRELEDGFPVTVDQLFSYDGLILGAVEAGAFTPAQLSLIREFADRRGGGVLFLGGRVSLSEGGWQKTTVAEMLPVVLPDRKGTFQRLEAKVNLGAGAGEHPITRLEEDPQKNAARWGAMPAVADFQEIGSLKPAALTLLELSSPNRGRLPLLVTQPFGRGRVAVLATGGTWRWQMLQDSKDKTHEAFWQQMLRWLVADTPGAVRGDIAANVIQDAGQVEFRAEARDRNYLPVGDATLEARVMGPNGLVDRVELRPDPASPGWSAAKWAAPVAGSFLAEIVARRGDEELGRTVTTFLREDGVAESFRTEQDRALLQQLAAQTGGAYYQPADAAKIADQIAFSEAGIARRELRDLWNAPIVFLLIAVLKGAEWLLRRKWGAV